MRNRLDSYYNDDEFLQLVDQYSTDYDNFYDLRNAIADELHSIIYNSNGRHSEINTYCSEAESLLNVYRTVIDKWQEMDKI